MENTSGTVNKALDILEIFLQKEGEFRLMDLADQTGLDRATAYRLISTLVKRKFLRQTKKNGKYSLGLKMVDCSFAIRRNLKLIDLAYLYLGKLNVRQKAAVNLTVLDDDKSLVIEEIGISSKGLPMSSPAVKRLPLYASACGKIFLASLSETNRKQYYSRNILKALSANTLTDVRELEKQLEDIKKEGVAFDREEYKAGQQAVAAPVFNRAGKVIAAASLIIPFEHPDPAKVQFFASEIKACAYELSQAISSLG